MSRLNWAMVGAGGENGGGKRREMGKREPGEKGEGGIGGGENKRTIKARTAKRTPPHGRVVQERKAGGRELKPLGWRAFVVKGRMRRAERSHALLC